MDKDTLAMARGNYGYGRWEAPYWFIGPEQGMANHGVNNLALRVKAWHELGSLELNDCLGFHHRIGEPQWHFQTPQVALQATWRPLMLLLMTFLERPANNDGLRCYQAYKWGALDENAGETCLAELSGLAAPNLAENPDTGIYRQERIQVMARRIRDHLPRLVLMYGIQQMDSWNAIARATAGLDFPSRDVAPDLPGVHVLTRGSTILVSTPAPTAFGLGNEYWRRLAKWLRRKAPDRPTSRV